MATLVLTAVGSAIGGPVGGAIGALLGRSADRALLGKAARREGPRLSELAVQTSSYGTQIPHLFGTMRVAGTVIWSTDLIETRTATAAGKGQPGVNNYSYRASFAVALSARPVVAVRRIWADGALLRGAAGDFKTATGFRLYPGGEDQPVDPLIAAALGQAVTPAHRGIAYAVFEDMQLAAYGNRIPSLTFEVVADAQPVTVGAIAATLAPEVRGAAAMAVGGFAASGGSVRAVLETLSGISGAWFADDGGALVMTDGAGDVPVIEDIGTGAQSRPRRRQTVAAIDTVPRSISVQHYDPARDYQTGVQRALRPGAGDREDMLALPVAVDADTAKAAAAAALHRALAQRTRRTVTTTLAALSIAPGACVSLTGERGVWRVSDIAVEHHAVTLTLVPLAVPAAAGLPADSGRALPAPDIVVGRTVLVAAELPGSDDGPLATPQLGIVAAGTGDGWRRAALMLSLDGGTSWTSAGATAAPGVVGHLATLPRAAAATLIDTASMVEVVLATAAMTLADATLAAMVDGANLAMMGGELVQFGGAEPLGDGRWRLTRLLRGRRGTEAMIGTQAIGDAFALVTADTVATLDLPLAALGTTVQVMASGVGDGDPALARAPIDGRSVLPLSPCHGRFRSDTGGGVAVDWVRRSRGGWRWLDGVDAPLGEEAQAYQVVATAADGTSQNSETATTTFAGAPSLATITVRQRGRLGLSPPMTVTIEKGHMR